MRYTIRPLGPWLEPETDPRQSSARFKAGWASTLQLLDRELTHLEAEHVVFQIDVAEADVRLDGMLRANAKVGHPGVRVAFDSRHGPLTYSTDAYENRYYGDLPSWQANIRAIALGLEALRAVDRYGITHKAEQYQGWKAIGPGPTGMPATRQMTVEDAARYLLAAIGDPLTPSVNAVITVPGTRQQVFRQAVRGLHPDVGGDPDLFKRVTEAKQVLDDHTGGSL